MNLTQQVKESLILANNTSNLSDDGFKKLLDNSFAALLNKPDIHNILTINNSKSDVIKQIYAALLTLIADAVRHNCTTNSIGTILNDELNFNQSRRELFCKMYDLQRERLQMLLSMIGTHPPHIIDVNWKMDYIIKTSSLNQPDGPIYRIRLSTEIYDDTIQNKRIEYINFNCNIQELQNLVYKLKDAVRHCEKVAADN